MLFCVSFQGSARALCGVLLSPVCILLLGPTGGCSLGLPLGGWAVRPGVGGFWGESFPPGVLFASAPGSLVVGVPGRVGAEKMGGGVRGCAPLFPSVASSAVAPYGGNPAAPA